MRNESFLMVRLSKNSNINIFTMIIFYRFFMENETYFTTRNTKKAALLMQSHHESPLKVILKHTWEIESTWKEHETKQDFVHPSV